MNKEDRKPKNTFQVQYNIQINSLVTTDQYLIVGTVGEVAAFKWTHVKNSKDVKPAWKIEIPNSLDSFEKVNVNCLLYNDEVGLLYAGCCDNAIYIINTDTGSLDALKGHSDYIHCLTKIGNELISGGEDGVVNIWDLRMKQIVNFIEPHKSCKIERPELGKWIGAVAVNEDWLLCGGGPRLSLWYLRSLNNSTVFPIDDRGIHVAEFYKDKILTGGRSKFFYQMNLNGDIVSEIPSSSVSIYSAVYQDEPVKALCLSGSSPNIDICSNMNYRDQVLTLL